MDGWTARSLPTEAFATLGTVGDRMNRRTRIARNDSGPESGLPRSAHYVVPCMAAAGTAIEVMEAAGNHHGSGVRFVIAALIGDNVPVFVDAVADLHGRVLACSGSRKSRDGEQGKRNGG